jgi:Flp pilus assembly protein TadG
VNQRGSIAIEFALVALFILFPLVAGMVEFGNIFFDKAIITNASREGARLLITYGQGDKGGLTEAQYEAMVQTNVITRVKQYCGDSGDNVARALINPGSSGSTVTVTLSGVPVPGTSTKGAPFTVTVQYVYRYMFLSFMSKMLPSFSSSINLGAQTTMGYEAPDQ